MKKHLLYIFLLFCFTSVFDVTSAQVLRPGEPKSEAATVIAYPNPATEYIILKVKDPLLKIKNVTIYSILGMQVASYNLNLNAAELNLEKLRAGKYLVKYQLSDSSQNVSQFVKQ